MAEDIEAKEEARLLKNRSSKVVPARGAAGAGATGGGSGLGGGNPKCARCGKSVYHNEKAIAAGKDWHQNCLKCKSCGKRLDATILCEKDAEVYCSLCYGRNFGPKGVGYGLGGSLTSIEPSPNATPSAPSQASTSTAPVTIPATPVVQSTVPGTANFCPNCGNPCAGMKFCASCGTKLI